MDVRRAAGEALDDTGRLILYGTSILAVFYFALMMFMVFFAFIRYRVIADEMQDVILATLDRIDIIFSDLSILFGNTVIALTITYISLFLFRLFYSEARRMRRSGGYAREPDSQTEAARRYAVRGWHVGRLLLIFLAFYVMMTIMFVSWGSAFQTIDLWEVLPFSL